MFWTLQFDPTINIELKDVNISDLSSGYVDYLIRNGDNELKMMY